MNSILQIEQRVLQDYKAMDSACLKVLKENHDDVTCDTCKFPGCCYQQLFVTPIEALPIALRIKRSNIDSDHLRQAYARLGLQMENSDRFTWFQEAHPCAFLDVGSGRCSIYEIRPVNCRTYYVFSPQHRCVPDILREKNKDDRDDTRVMDNSDFIAHIIAHMMSVVASNRMKFQAYIRSISYQVAMLLEALDNEDTFYKTIERKCLIAREKLEAMAIEDVANELRG